MIKITSATAGLLGLLALSTAAAAQTAPVPSGSTAQTAPTAAPAPPVGVEERDRIVCRSVQQTGSRFPVRVCTTRREKDTAREVSKHRVERFLERNLPNTVASKGP
jgi:hypothetical protein